MSGRPVTIVRHSTQENYTVLPNAIANDERIPADEMAVLVWMLTRPPDWEVRRPVLKKRFGFGRDRLRRIFGHLRELKYSKQEAVRRDDGTVEFYRITVADRPIFESHESTEIDADEDDSPDEDTAHQPPEKTAAVHQPTPQPSPGNTSPELSNEKIINNPPTPQAGMPADRPKAAEEASGETSPPGKSRPSFSAMKLNWPPDHILSATTAERRFLRLSESQQWAAIDRAPAYLGDMRSRGWKVCDLTTYLRDKRFERLATPIKAAAFPIKGGTPQAFRWLEYREAIRESTAYMRECFATGRPWYAPTEWPPALPKSTGPPSSKSPLMTPQDEEELEDL